MITHILGFVLVAAFVAWAGYTAYQFKQATGTFAQRLAASTKNSITLFVNAAATAALTLGNGILNVSDALVGPEFRAFIEANLGVKTATGAIAFLVLINVAGRFRSLGGK